MRVISRYSDAVCAIHWEGYRIMCGIVGYVGERRAQDVLLAGLGKLEYRGYDSAGIAVFRDGAIEVSKSVGRLGKLVDVLAGAPMEGTLGVGHTRWATHGRPSVANAHPHVGCAREFVVVHNGIIENYLQLREELQASGHHFTSETDTEVVAHLLEDHYRGDLLDAVFAIVGQIRGAYALAIMTEREPDRIVAVRKHSPLVIGLGEGENFVASDIPALLEYTRDVYVMQEGEVAVVTRNAVNCYNFARTAVGFTPLRVTWDAQAAEKDGYEHYMLKEIHEQPKAVRDTISGRVSTDAGRVVLPEFKWTEDDIRAIDRIHIVACGTSYHAGLVGKVAIERLAKVPVDVEIASEYRYRDPIVSARTLVVAISQSGETLDTLAAVRNSQRRGNRVLAVTNVVGSSLAREADDVLVTWAGPEISVCSTKAYTTQLIALYLLAGYLAQARGTAYQVEIAALIGELQQLPAKLAEVLKTAPLIDRVARAFSAWDDAFFLGRGLDFAVALEGALKYKEISYIHAEAYPAGELKHGTLALIVKDVPVIALVTQDDLYEKTVSNILEVKARDAQVLAIAWEGDEAIGKSVDRVLYVPRTIPFLAPVLLTVPLQLLAYYASVARGNDVDKPRNLAKSVTVE